METSSRRRAHTYWIIGIALILAYGISRGSEWHGSATLHTVMEAVGTLLALLVGIMALVRYYTLKGTVFLIVGAGFLGTAFLDGYHTIVTSAFFKSSMPSDLGSLIPWSWIASRLFLSVFMVLSWITCLRAARSGEMTRGNEGAVYLFTGLFTLTSFLFFVLVPLPRAYYPELFFGRPEEFIPAVLFGVALVGHLRLGHWKDHTFEHWLVLSLIVGLIGQTVFMSFSTALFDFEFDAAHLLKKVSYVCVLTGLLVSMSSIFLSERAATKQLKAVISRTKEMAREAELANLAKSEFLANMSHEIRTPMTAILGFTENLLGSDYSESDRLDALLAVRRNGEHLLELINDILDLSKIEASKMTVERIETPLAKLLLDVVSMMRPRAADKGVAMRTIARNPIPDRIMSDPTRLRQILINLIGNAAKFTEAGEIEIRLTTIDARGARRLRFEIEDSGPGMTAEQAAALFRPFGQADSSITRKHGGTGLGLTICRRLAELMDGEVRLDYSEPGKGSRFVVELPLIEAPGAILLEDFTIDSASRSGSAAREPEQSAPSLTGRILLAEDGVDNQRLITFHLKKAGAEVDIADNGRIALEMIDAADERGNAYDLLITDMQMPEMDGYALATELRARGCTMPIVALTAHAMASDRQKCLDAGCDDYASKPLDRFALISTCAQWLEIGTSSHPTGSRSAPAADPGDEPFISETAA